MASTGEVACFGETVEEAYLKAILASGGSIPRRGVFLSVMGEDKYAPFLECARQLSELNLPLYTCEDTWQVLHANDIRSTKLHYETVRQHFSDDSIDLAIIVTSAHHHRTTDKQDEHYMLRRLAIDSNIPLITKIKQAQLFIRTLRTVGEQLIAPNRALIKKREELCMIGARTRRGGGGG
jgi:hypothetical protein